MRIAYSSDVMRKCFYPCPFKIHHKGRMILERRNKEYEKTRICDIVVGNRYLIKKSKYRVMGCEF